MPSMISEGGRQGGALGGGLQVPQESERRGGARARHLIVSYEMTHLPRHKFSVMTEAERRWSHESDDAVWPSRLSPA